MLLCIKMLVSKCYRRRRTFFLVEYVQQDDADFVIGLNFVVEEHRNDALHGVL